jgi:hypothetical protein
MTRRHAFPLLLSALAPSSCALFDPVGSGPIRVDLARRQLSYRGLTCPIGYGRGIGHRKGSRRTPTGTYRVTKESRHRFGPVLRLSGYQGHVRGILVHRRLHPGPSSGCIVLEDPAMRRLFALVPPDGEDLVITA